MLGFSTRMQVECFLKDHGAEFPVTVVAIAHNAEISRRFREQWPLSHRPLLIGEVEVLMFCLQCTDGL